LREAVAVDAKVVAVARVDSALALDFL